MTGKKSKKDPAVEAEKKLKQEQDRRDMLSPAYVVRESKRKVRELEERNYSSIILWKSNAKWWKMCENSALIYYYHVAPMIEREPKIHIDTDRYFNSEVGVISIAEETLPGLTEVLAGHDIKKSERSTETIMSYVLPKALSEAEVKSFRLQEQGARDKVNEILRGENLEQYLDAEIRKTVSILFTITKKMDDHRKWFVGKAMAERALELYTIKNRMERRTIGKKQACIEIRELVDQEMTYANIMLEMRMLDVYKMEGLAKHLYNIRTECNRIIAEETKLEIEAGKRKRKDVG